MKKMATAVMNYAFPLGEKNRNDEGHPPFKGKAFKIAAALPLQNLEIESKFPTLTPLSSSEKNYFFDSLG